MRFFLRKINKNSIPSWVIKPQIPWHKRPSFLLTFSIVLISILGSYLYLNYSLQNTMKQLSKVSRKYSSLSEKYVDLKITKVKLQRELEVAQQSQVKIKDNLLSLHQQSQDLTEQVDLYKRIMGTEHPDNNIAIENLHLRQIENANQYYLSFVLLQLNKKKSMLEGRVDLKLQGLINDKSTTFVYSQLTSNKAFPLSYRFRDFQQINEKIELPENFIVRNLIVAITDNKLKQTKTTNFDWNLVGGQEIHVAQNEKN